MNRFGVEAERVRARRPMRTAWPFLIAAPVLAACADRPREPVGVPHGPLAVLVAQVSQDPTPDQLAVAHVVPGFGGYFLDASGQPTVYLTDPGRRSEAEQALAAGCMLEELRARCRWFRANMHDWPAERRAGALFVGLAEAVPGLAAELGWPYRAHRRS